MKQTKKTGMTRQVLGVAIASFMTSQLSIANSVVDKTMPRVDVIGSEQNLTTIGGSAHIIDSKQLETSRPVTVNEALRQVPGVHVRDEEGFGMRPNIAMRGLNPTRSTKISLLEDGIPLAYAPYGDNASYYHPQIDRYERIEVLKGAETLLFGPQTVGGVINYITPQPPQKFGGFVQGSVGNNDHKNARVNIGGKGFLLDYTLKQGDGARDNTNHAIDDLNLKYAFNIGSKQAMTLRANYYREDSTVTYSGLTQAEFDRRGPRYNPFKNDVFDVERKGFSATHDIELSKGINLTTSVYLTTLDRDWWRQSSNSTDNQGGVAAARLAGNLINADTINSVQGRLRSYETKGVDSRVAVAHGLGELQAGVKLQWEEQNRRQVNGTSPLARTGALAEHNDRDTEAVSVFVANRFDVAKNVAITPIVRHEHIDSSRTNRLNNTLGSTKTSATTPGIGITWSPNKETTVFSSLHKGFAPPRVEDLINGTGVTVADVDVESSVNFELGVRAKPTNWLSLQTAYFRNDYDNLIAVGSIAGGSTPLAQGKALFEGVEFAARAQANNGLFSRVAYTYLPTAEQKTAFVNVANKTNANGSLAGNRQPYAPENALTMAVGYKVGAFTGELEAQHVGDQFSDFANTRAGSADGQRGIIKAHTVLNTTLNYQMDKSTTLFMTGKNITDETYIVDRTRGIVVGMPLLVQAGVKYKF